MLKNSCQQLSTTMVHMYYYYGYIEEEQHDDEAALDAEEMAVSGRDEEGSHCSNKQCTGRAHFQSP